MTIDRQTATDLKTHLYRLVTNNLLWEFNDQLEAWNGYVDLLADAQEAASTAQSQALQEAGAELAAQQQRAFAASMLVLNLVAGFAVSWLGASIKENWSRQFTTDVLEVEGSKALHVSKLIAAQYGDPEHDIILPITKVTKVEPGPVVRTMAGKVGEGLANIFVQMGLPKPPDPPKPQAIDMSFAKPTGAPNWQSYKTSLKQVLSKQQEDTRNQIRAIANSIENDPLFGIKIGESLLKQQPKLRDASWKEQEQAGFKWLNSQINAQRNQWVDKKEWFYYCFDPPAIAPTFLNHVLEREMWAVWILQTNPHVDYATIWGSRLREVHPLGGGGRAGFELPVYGKDDVKMLVHGELLFTDAVLQHLFYLGGIPIPMYFLGVTTSPPVSRVDEAAHLMLWAKDHKPELHLKDYMVPRMRPLVPIENYTRRYTNTPDLQK